MKRTQRKINFYVCVMKAGVYPMVWIERETFIWHYFVALNLCKLREYLCQTAKIPLGISASPNLWHSQCGRKVFKCILFGEKKMLMRTCNQPSRFCCKCLKDGDVCFLFLNITKEQITQTIGWYGCQRTVFIKRCLVFFYHEYPQSKIQEIKQMNQASYLPCK